MNGLRDALRRTGGIHAVAARLDQPYADIAAIADAALPLLAGAVHVLARRLGGGETGCRAVLTQLEQMGGGELAAAVMTPGADADAAGDAMLAFLLPEAGARSAIVNAAARQAGQAVWLAAASIPVLAMLMGGYVAARSLEMPQACRIDELLDGGDEAALAAVYADAGIAP
jgi:hypothetical protein